MQKYSYETILNKDQLDENGNLLPTVALRLFQKAAGDHAKLLGVGYDALSEKGLLWVVTQIRYEAVKAPAADQKITVETWPLPANRLGFERNYLIYDEKGEILIKGSSNWVIMDAKERKMALVGGLYPEMDFCLDKPFPDRARRLRDFEAESPACTIIPDESTIDENRHVNNTFYAAFAIEALGGLQGPLKHFQIDYLHEVLCGEALKLYCTEEENTAFVKGENEEGTRMYACSITY